MSTSFCETCAERGRPNEPVYKLGMCEFCYKGLRHPKATREQLAKETTGQTPDTGTSSLRRLRLGRENSAFRDRASCPNPII
jgi:hypothetical protein